MTSLSAALWRLYNRPQRPIPFAYGGNLPYDDPAFSQRMLQLHLSDDDAAASRVSAERTRQIAWMQNQLALAPGDRLLDVACGPGLYAVPLAQQGVRVTGIDFAPAAIIHGRQLAQEKKVTATCTFLQQDMRQLHQPAHFDTAILLYGQLAVMPKEEAADLLTRLYAALKPGGKLLLELLDPGRVDMKNSQWWFTDDTGLWGDTPYLHLGERIWYPDTRIALERYHIVDLQTGNMDEVTLCDQVYDAAAITTMLHASRFATVTVHPHWDNIGLYDQDEWCVYIATKA